MQTSKLTLVMLVISLILSNSVKASANDVVMLHCKDQNISIHKEGLYLLIHGFGTDLKYQR
ncbi:MAG: hypothetical protein KJO91_04595, partial [Gammaproteobacteria bacterium]|nr:hypothetical protein [Gammaproteobacteria bacterium]